MLRRGFFFLDELVDQAGYAAATKAARGLMARFSFRIPHKPSVKGFFRSYVIVIVKCQFAAFAALQVFRHGHFLLIPGCPLSHLLTGTAPLFGNFLFHRSGNCIISGGPSPTKKRIPPDSLGTILANPVEVNNQAMSPERFGVHGKARFHRQVALDGPKVPCRPTKGPSQRAGAIPVARVANPS